MVDFSCENKHFLSLKKKNYQRGKILILTNFNHNKGERVAISTNRILNVMTSNIQRKIQGLHTFATKLLKTRLPHCYSVQVYNRCTYFCTVRMRQQPEYISIPTEVYSNDMGREKKKIKIKK